MGYKLRNFYWSCSILVTLFVFSFFTSYGYAAEIQITTNSANQINPSISGNYIVWQDHRNSPAIDLSKNPDIYGYNLLTGSEVTIASEGVFNPDYYIDQLFPFGGEKVVWSATPAWSPILPPDGLDSEIYFYNFLNPVSNGTPVTSDSYKQSSPAISGNRVVWQDERNGNWDIYSRTVNLSNNTFGTETAIVTASGSQNRPRIDGNKVVWTDYRNGYPYPNNNIYFYDFSSPVANGVPVTSGSYERDKPAVSGNRVVWQDKRNGNWDIYMKDVSSGAETRITTDLYSQINPAIYGNIIIWEDYRAGGNSNIYLYNISTGVEAPLTSGDYYHNNPAIYDNKVVWADGRNGGYIDQFGLHNSDIYLTYIDTTSPTTPTSLSATPISSTQIDLNWTASTDNVGVVGYRIYRGDLFVGTTTTTSYSDTGLSPSTPYSYQVSAYDSSGNESGKSNTESATTKSAPPTISSVVPNTGLNTGPTNITINGTNFALGATAKIGSTSLTNVVRVSSGQITATVPAGLSPATYSITVTNLDGQSGSINGFIVTAPNQSPAAVIDSITPDPATQNQSVSFTGHGTDPDGSITEYFWGFGDGATSSSQNPTHTYGSTGTYNVTFKVRDNSGAWSFEVSRSLTVNAPPAPPPPSDGGGGGGSSPPPSSGGDPAPAAQSTPAGKIRGRIISSSGLAILGTPARINDTRVATNLNGEFEFSGLSDGIYTVYYEADGYVSQTQVLPVSNGGITNAPMVIMSPARPTGRIRGRIINTSGIPILGMPARIDASRAATTLNGEFEFNFVADGVYTLWYDAPGYITQSQVLVVVNGGITTSPTVIMSPNGVSIQTVGKGKKAARRRVVRRRRR